MALLALAPPNCSISRSGCRPLGGGDRGEGGIDPVLRSVESPAISKPTRAAWPSAETSLSPVSGDVTFSTYWTRDRRLDHVLDGRPELGILDGELVALHEDDLFGRPQAGAVERLLGFAGLTRELIDVGDVLLADHVHADEEDDEDERKPAEDGLLAVLPAPAGHPGREVVCRRRRGDRAVSGRVGLLRLGAG